MPVGGITGFEGLKESLGHSKPSNFGLEGILRSEEVALILRMKSWGWGMSGMS